MKNKILIQPLTTEAFAPYGEVVGKKGHAPLDMNGGMAKNYRAIAQANTKSEEGETVISIVTSFQYDLPYKINVVERHPLGSQAFIPQHKTPFIVIVAAAGDWQGSKSLIAFKSDGTQGINYSLGTWHSPLFTPYAEMDFICIDRQGKGNNCEVIQLDDSQALWIEE